MTGSYLLTHHMLACRRPRAAPLCSWEARAVLHRPLEAAAAAVAAVAAAAAVAAVAAAAVVAAVAAVAAAAAAAAVAEVAAAAAPPQSLHVQDTRHIELKANVQEID